MNERRYDEDEVRRIFDLATRDSPAASPPSLARGLTLSDVQDIGSEVGVDRAAIARAAAALEAGPVRAPRTSLGMPIEVGRIVPLVRAPTDPEWEQIVSELRSTFRATGRLTRQGGLREWTNGNLHACIEQGAHGYRLRLGTVKGDAAGVNALGATTLLAGGAVLASMLLAGEPAGGIAVSSLLGASGIGAFLANMVRLPRWAKTRAAQMEHIAGVAASIVQPARPDVGPRASIDPQT